MRTLLSTVLIASVCAGPLGSQSTLAHPRDGEIHDADTKAWWHTTEALSDDSREGRDTGTLAYQHAAVYVSSRFMQAGLQPAGDKGTYFQNVPMDEIDILPDGTSFVLTRASGKVELAFLQQITVSAGTGWLSKGEAALVFRGYCGKESMGAVQGKIVVCFGTQRQGLPSSGERAANARAGGALGLVNVDDPYFSIEPPRWPMAYARSVSLKPHGEPLDLLGATLPPMRLSAEGFAVLLEGSGQDAAALLKLGGAKQPLPSFDIPGRLSVTLHRTEHAIASPNVLAVLPGSDPGLKNQYVVISAHLDGYGFGTPVKGDSLYNGTLDDAAYVALLIQMADDIKAGKLPRPKRSLLFAAFTGEEKGLLGSNWFVQHPTVPVADMAADVNLDQLRPLFPLKILTVEALTDTTLGTTAQQVGAAMEIELRPDREPERGLLRRADQFPFLKMGVPAISFIFGYDPGTEAERRYREWYEVRYHRPQDDLTQPMDFEAARKFDSFFYALVEAIANGADRPKVLPGSPFAAKP
jgi:hypothetical protein